MEFTKISQSEVELAKNAVTNIINAEIQKHELTGELPEVNEISDSNKKYLCYLLICEIRPSYL